jgi:hypothetical protein
LRIFDRDLIHWQRVVFNRVACAAEFEPVLARDLRGVDVATGKLRRFGFGFIPSFFELIEV